jgi:hypothetical protein
MALAAQSAVISSRTRGRYVCTNPPTAADFEGRSGEMMNYFMIRHASEAFVFRGQFHAGC